MIEDPRGGGGERPSAAGSRGCVVGEGASRRRRSGSLLLLRFLLIALFTGAISFLALRSSPYLQHVPWLPRRLGEWADSNGILRNVVAFVALGLAVFVLAGRRLWHFVALAGFAAGVEIAQLWIPGRIFDWRDIVASVGGVLLAWPVAWAVERWRHT